MRPVNLLFSYHYFKNWDLSEVERILDFPARLFIDSGAYSANSQGVPVSLDQYSGWLLDNKDFIFNYVNLDVIGNYKATARNQDKMEAMGLSPVPVYHASSPWPEFERLCRNYPYVALGGAVGIPLKHLFPWYVKCFQSVRSKGLGTLFHGFGITANKVILSLPWYSVDSSAFGAGYRYGVMQVFDPMKGRMVKCRLFDRASVLASEPILREHGISVVPFLSRDAYHHSDVMLVSIRSWRAMELFCKRRHGDIGTDPSGLHLHLAMSGSDFQNGSRRTLALTKALKEEK